MTALRAGDFAGVSIKKILICGELGPDLHGRSLCFGRYHFSLNMSLISICTSAGPWAGHRAAEGAGRERVLLQRERAGNKAGHLFIYFAGWLIYS